MPLDYSKWDKLEISDDEDVEVHPNVDKRSFIRWKQEAIHRDRRDRKDKIAALEMEKASNAALLKEMESFVGKRDGTEASLAALATKYGQLQEKQKEDIFRMRFTDRDERWGPPVPDEFVEGRIDYKATLESAASDTSKLESAIAMIKKRQAKIVETIAKEMDEQNKKITSENWGKVGFDKTVVNDNQPKADVEETPVVTKPAKKTVTTVETINEPKPSVASSASPQAPHPPAQETEEEEDEDEEDDTKLKDPGVAKFAAAKTITESFAIIQKYPYIVQSQHSDAILAAAFSAAYKEKPGFDVKQMVFQSTILSYCLTLSQGGKDGVALFFKRVADDMKSSAYQGFAADAQAMYDRIMARIKVLQEKDRKDREEAIQRAQARLDAAKQPDGSYRWPIPADASEEDQKKAAIFDTFHKDLQLGLLIEDVDAINKHLSTLTREDGEALLKKIAEGGFLQIIEEGEEEQ